MWSVVAFGGGGGQKEAGEGCVNYFLPWYVVRKMNVGEQGRAVTATAVGYEKFSQTLVRNFGR